MGNSRLNPVAALILLACLIAVAWDGFAQSIITDVDNDYVCVYWPKNNRTEKAVEDNCPQSDLGWTVGCVEYLTEGKDKILLFAPEPDSRWDTGAFKILGHEFYHAVRGSFHP